jgi:hypothetical protein
VTNPNDSRRGTAEKILPILDVIYAVLGAVLAIWGRRKGDVTGTPDR